MLRAHRFLPAVAVATGIYLLSDRNIVVNVPTIVGGVLAISVHFTEYALLAGSLRYALALAPVSPAVPFALAALYAVSDEIHQRFVPGRNASPLDLIPDLLGAWAGIVAYDRLSAALSARRTAPRSSTRI